jgi:hypothetical protein
MPDATRRQMADMCGMATVVLAVVLWPRIMLAESQSGILR